MGDMQKIVVIGAGTMGNGIAHTAAASGFPTTLIDVDQPILDRALSTISANLQRGVDKVKMTADEKQTILGRINATSDMAAVTNADLVVEAIIENLAAKTALFAQLDRVTKPECILSSNTSSISITKIAAATNRPEKGTATHSTTPVPVIALSEPVPGITATGYMKCIPITFSGR